MVIGLTRNTNHNTSTNLIPDVLQRSIIEMSEDAHPPDDDAQLRVLTVEQPLSSPNDDLVDAVVGKALDQKFQYARDSGVLQRL